MSASGLKAEVADPLSMSANDPKRTYLIGKSERQGAFDAATVLLDEIAELAFVIEPQGGSADPDHIHAGPDIAENVVGRGGDAERADASRRALEARQQRKVGIVEEGRAAAHVWVQGGL